MQNYTVYIHRNIINNKAYIGVTKKHQINVGETMAKIIKKISLYFIGQFKNMVGITLNILFGQKV